MLQLQRTLLQRAAQITGSEARLCAYLEVSEVRFRLWSLGTVRIPDPIFLRLVDLILRDDIARASGDRRHAPREHDYEARRSDRLSSASNSTGPSGALK